MALYFLRTEAILIFAVLEHILGPEYYLSTEVRFYVNIKRNALFELKH
jgi:hypothetical protein